MDHWSLVDFRDSDLITSHSSLPTSQCVCGAFTLWNLILVLLSGQMETQKQAKAKEKAICEFCGQGFNPYGIGSHKKACQKWWENERVDQQVVEKELRDRKAKEEGAWLFTLPNLFLYFIPQQNCWHLIRAHLQRPWQHQHILVCLI